MPQLPNPYHIALSRIPGLGNKTLRQLVGYCPNPEQLFDMSHAQLAEIFKKHTDIIAAFENKAVLKQAETEVEQLKRYGIETLFFTDADYPQRLNNAGCEDSPALLYRLGSCNLNAERTVALVGSRKCSDYGFTTTTRLVTEMAADRPLIVSGLAYGIDTAAHKACVENDVPTVAVLGHGLDIIYPNQNKPLAKSILEKGGSLLTEYPLGTAINPKYFPARNRIVAGMADATVVVESAERGGGLITANMANSYHREVFAVPGRLGDPLSEGCNNLIVNNKAIMLRNAGDIYFQMGWQGILSNRRHKEEQQSLFATLSGDELAVVNLLKEFREMSMDEIDKNCTLSLPKIASLLLDLELKGVVRCLPGRLYKLV